MPKREVKLTAYTELGPRSLPREMQKERVAGPGKGFVKNLHNQQVFSIKKSPGFAPIRALLIMEITILFATLAVSRASRDNAGESWGDAGVNPSGFSCVSVLLPAGNLPSPAALTQRGEAEAVKCVLGFGEVFGDAPVVRG